MPPRDTRVQRVVAFVALLCVPFVVSTAWMHHTTRPLARACCYYRPVDLGSGALWKVIGSAVLLINPHPFGPTVLLSALVLLPYLVVRGVRRALTVFFAGHLTATAAVALVIAIGAAVHAPGAHHLAHESDVGMSAGLAAVAGALTVLLARSYKIAAVVPLALMGLALVSGVAHHHWQVESEHVIALATGIAIELFVRTPSRAVTPTPVPTVPRVTA